MVQITYFYFGQAPGATFRAIDYIRHANLYPRVTNSNVLQMLQLIEMVFSILYSTSQIPFFEKNALQFITNKRK